ncbi:MAG: hypothetical protein ACK5O2_13075, partial [Microthrixaceae bacterium]
RRHHRLEHSNLDWKLHTVTVADLPAELAEQHRQRAINAGLDPDESASSACTGRSGSAGGTERGEEARSGQVWGGQVLGGNESDPGDSGGSGCSNVNTVRIWTGPDGQRVLAQIAADHHPPPMGKPDTSPGMSDPPPPPDG